MAKKDTELITLDWYKRAQKINTVIFSADNSVLIILAILNR